jgi:hypothetical protein
MSMRKCAYLGSSSAVSFASGRFEILVDYVKASKLATLRFLSLLFLLPGLGGLVVSAVISTSYLDSLPRSAAADELRVVPRNIHGTLVYQTQAEDRRLSLMEDSSVGVFLVGLCMGLVYLERWGNVRSSELELDKEDLSPAGSK